MVASATRTTSTFQIRRMVERCRAMCAVSYSVRCQDAPSTRDDSGRRLTTVAPAPTLVCHVLASSLSAWCLSSFGGACPAGLRSRLPSHIFPHRRRSAERCSAWSGACLAYRYLRRACCPDARVFSRQKVGVATTPRPHGSPLCLPPRQSSGFSGFSKSISSAQTRSASPAFGVS